MNRHARTWTKDELHTQRTRFEADFVAEQKRNSSTDEYIFLVLQQSPCGDYRTTYVHGRWQGWLAAKADEPVLDLLEALQQAKMGLEAHLEYVTGKEDCNLWTPTVFTLDKINAAIAKTTGA